MRFWRWLKRLFKKPVRSKPMPSQPRIDNGDFTPTQYQDNYSNLWETMVINPKKQSVVDWYVKKIKEGQARYEAVSLESKVPWQIIGCLHLMEGAGDFSGVLHNGEKIIGTGRKTRLVPKGRGPFDTWEEAAIDAMRIKKQPKEWNIVNTLYYAERYNGLGYLRDPNKPNSPYLWSMSNHYTRGKYTHDGRYSPTAVSKQCGIAVILKELGFTGV